MTRWLDDEEMQAWRGLIDAFNEVNAQLGNELLGTHGLTGGDYEVLVFLSEAENHQMRMCDLASRLHLSPSGLTRRLDGLVQQGFVLREASTEDRRVAMAVLTRKGLAKLESAAPDHVDGVRRHFLDHLSRTQVRQLGAAFTALQRGMTSTADK